MENDGEDMFDWMNVKKELPGVTDEEWDAVQQQFGDHPDKNVIQSLDERRPLINGIKQKSARMMARQAIIKECVRVERETEQQQLSEAAKQEQTKIDLAQKANEIAIEANEKSDQANKLAQRANETANSALATMSEQATFNKAMLGVAIIAAFAAVVSAIYAVTA